MCVRPSFSTFESVDIFSLNFVRTFDIGGHPNAVHYDFLHSVVTWWTRELSRRKRLWCHLREDPEMIRDNGDGKICSCF